MRRINQNGIKLIKEFEGMMLTSYKCPAGIWTLAFGHTGLYKGKKIGPGITITKEEAETLLANDLESVAIRLEPLCPDNLNDNQFSALVSFAFNCGIHAFKTSTARRRMLNGDMVGAMEALKWFNKVTDPFTGEKEVLKGLARRREAEVELFNTPVEDPLKERITRLEAKLDAIQEILNGSSRKQNPKRDTTIFTENWISRLAK